MSTRPRNTLLEIVRRRWRLFAAAYAGLVVSYLALVGLWLSEGLTVDGGVAVFAAWVGVVLLGANGLFLYAVLDQIEATREGFVAERERMQRAASPYLHPWSVGELSIQNVGGGGAMAIRCRRFRKLDEPDTLEVEVTHIAGMHAGQIPQPMKEWDRGARIQGFVLATAGYLYAIECSDVYDNRHLRWFEALPGNRYVEVAAEPALLPAYAPSPPEGVHPTASQLQAVLHELA